MQDLPTNRRQPRARLLQERHQTRHVPERTPDRVCPYPRARIIYCGSEVFLSFRRLRETPPRSIGERHHRCQKRKCSHTMLLQEVIVIECDAEKLSAGHPQAKIGDHCILNGGVAQIPAVVGGYQSDAGAWLQHFAFSSTGNLCDLHALDESLTCANHERSRVTTHLCASPPNQASNAGSHRKLICPRAKHGCKVLRVRRSEGHGPLQS